MSELLRPWTMDDLDSLLLYGDNPKIARFMSDGFPHPYTLEKGIAFIENATKDSPLRIFAIDQGGVAVGGIGIHPQADIHRRNAELGYWLGEPFWGKGIITEAIIGIVDYAFKNFDIYRIFARPFSSNPASQKALIKSGFSLEAKFEKTIIKNDILLDEMIFAIRKAH